MQGRFETAVESLKSAIALSQTYPEPHYLLGKLYHRLGKEDLAAAEVARFQQLKASADGGVPASSVSFGPP
jgi:Flp pilus assembly protein TadD